MVGVTHVFLHLALCTAIAREKPDASVAYNVTLRPHQGDVLGPPQFDQTFHITRGDADEAVIEFDAPSGSYAMNVSAPKEGCGHRDFVVFLSEHARTIALALDDTPHDSPPVTVLDGTAPPSFLYVKPQFVLLDKSVACNQPVGTPLAAHETVENDRDAYYVWLYHDGAPATGSTLALKLATATGLYHYINVPIPFPQPWRGWPEIVRFNVTEDAIDDLATEKTGVLLCPKLWKTSAG